MATGYYLLDHENPNAPNRGDGRYWGYATMNNTPRVIVVHTTESPSDFSGPDSGAENVANWFATNTTTASYHTLVDSDSTIRCLPAGLAGTVPHTAFHAAEYNSMSLGVSMAMRADSWPTVPASWASRVISACSTEVALLCVRWNIPVARLTKAQVDAGAKGIVGHVDLHWPDRSDPGAGFDWSTFLAQVRTKLKGEDEDMTPEQNAMLIAVHGAVATHMPGWGRPASANDVVSIMAARVDGVAALVNSVGAKVDTGVNNLSGVANQVVQVTERQHEATRAALEQTAEFTKQIAKGGGGGAGSNPADIAKAIVALIPNAGASASDIAEAILALISAMLKNTPVPNIKSTDTSTNIPPSTDPPVIPPPEIDIPVKVP